jgi:hypothetical protein
MSRKSKGQQPEITPSDAPTLLLAEHEAIVARYRKQVDEQEMKLKAMSSENHNLHAKVSSLMSEIAAKGDKDKLAEGLAFPGSVELKAVDSEVKVKPKLVKVQVLKDLGYTDWEGHSRHPPIGAIIDYEEDKLLKIPKSWLKRVTA